MVYWYYTIKIPVVTMKKITTQLTDKQYKSLKEYSQDNEVTMAYVIRQAIREWLEQKSSN